MWTNKRNGTVDFIYDASSESPMQSCLRRFCGIIKRNLLLLCLIIALFLGIALGAGLRAIQPPLSKRGLMYVKFPGDLLMRMLSMLILPLIVSSLITGMAGLDTRASGKLGLRAVIYYLTTTLAAVILGIILVIAIGPGYRGERRTAEGEFKRIHPADTFLDLIRSCFPDNIVSACFQKPLTVLKPVTPKNPTPTPNTSASPDDVNATTLSTTSLSTMMTSLAENLTNTTTPPAPQVEYDPVLTNAVGMNVLGLVVFSIAMGIILGRLGERGKPLVLVFDALCEATMKLIYLVICYSPIGVMFLVASHVVSMEDLAQTFEKLALYFITVMIGLVIHGFITLPLVYFVIVRKNPYKFMQGVQQALLIALGTSSSSATLPETMRCLEENNGIDPRIVKFVAPVGATINMDGTALYEAVAVIFIGQNAGYDLSFANVVIISIAATAAAIGAAGVPQAGLVTMVIVLTAVGFPTDDVVLILAIDWLLDRFRTSINVLGDAFGAGIVDHLSREDMAMLDTLDGEAEEMRTLEVNGVTNGHVNGAFASVEARYTRNL